MNIRLETPADYREVENLTRESFWNVYRPGCTEEEEVPFFLAQELIPGWLKANGITEATYRPPKGYFMAEEHPEAFEAYEATFPPKEKLRLPGQLGYEG